MESFYFSHRVEQDFFVPPDEFWRPGCDEFPDVLNPFKFYTYVLLFFTVGFDLLSRSTYIGDEGQYVSGDVACPRSGVGGISIGVDGECLVGKCQRHSDLLVTLF